MSGVPRRKKNHAAPTMSHRRPISDVSCGDVRQQRRRWRRPAPASARGTAPPPPAAPSRRRCCSRRRRRPTASSESARPSGWRRNATTRQRQHAEPEMPLVIEREIAIAGRSVRRQVEQQQPADAGREDQTGIAEARGDVLGSGRERPAQPRRAEEHDDRRGAEQPEHESGGHRQRVGRFATEHERVSRRERPRHAADPRRDRPDARARARRRRVAVSRRRLSLSRSSPASIHAAHCQPAVRSSVAHRLVLGRPARRGACVGHQRRRGGETTRRPARLRRRHRVLALRGDRKRGGARERRRCAMTVERRAEEQHRIRSCGLLRPRSGRGRLRKRAFDPVERAGERARTRRWRHVDRVALDKRLDFGVDRLRWRRRERAARRTFALLLSKLGRPRLRVVQGCEERFGCCSDRAGERERHALDARAFRSRADSSAKAVAYDRLGKRRETRAELGQDGGRAGRGRDRPVRRTARRGRFPARQASRTGEAARRSPPEPEWPRSAAATRCRLPATDYRRSVWWLSAKDLPFAFEAALPAAHPPRTATDHVCEDGFRSATVEPICSAHCDFILGKCSPRFASPTSVQLGGEVSEKASACALR